MRITYEKIIDSIEEIKRISKENEFVVSGLVVHALANYVNDREKALDMIQVLMDENIQPMSNLFKSQIDDRMRQNNKAGYIAKSYFEGAVPENNYTPSIPFAINVETNPYTYQDQGYARMLIKSGGADSNRIITLRKTKDNRWLLFSDSVMGLLADIRKPESENPWA